MRINPVLPAHWPGAQPRACERSFVRLSGGTTDAFGPLAATDAAPAVAADAATPPPPLVFRPNVNDPPGWTCVRRVRSGDCRLLRAQIEAQNADGTDDVRATYRLGGYGDPGGRLFVTRTADTPQLMRHLRANRRVRCDVHTMSAPCPPGATQWIVHLPPASVALMRDQSWVTR